MRTSKTSIYITVFVSLLACLRGVIKAQIARILTLVIAATLLPTQTVAADTLRIAVASNFVHPMKALIAEYESTSPHTIKASYGSSGKFYAQIANGAPYDLFLSADMSKPRMLLDTGLAVKGSLKDYAQGRLTLWHPNAEAGVSSSIITRLERQPVAISSIALATPTLAPYGYASEQVIERLGLKPQKRLVAENVSQAFQFGYTGNAEYAFVALAQLQTQPPSRYWVVPQSLYDPIIQSSVVIASSANKDLAIKFNNFIVSEVAQRIIRDHGYKSIATIHDAAEAASSNTNAGGEKSS